MVAVAEAGSRLAEAAVVVAVAGVACEALEQMPRMHSVPHGHSAAVAAVVAAAVDASVHRP